MSARILKAPRPNYVRPGDKLDGMAEFASPEAIRIHLKNAREQENRWRKLGERLTELLADRLSQIESGEWPPTATGSEDR